jgi:hypothetical protein
MIATAPVSSRASSTVYVGPSPRSRSPRRTATGRAEPALLDHDVAGTQPADGGLERRAAASTTA